MCKLGNVRSAGLPERVEVEKGAAIRGWYSYPNNIISIYVGNEDLHPVGPFSPDDIIKHMQGQSLSLPVGQVDRRTHDFLVRRSEGCGSQGAYRHSAE
jgi:hypothetical protein